jgi:hypothetical protein
VCMTPAEDCPTFTLYDECDAVAGMCAYTGAECTPRQPSFTCAPGYEVVGTGAHCIPVIYYTARLNQASLSSRDIAPPIHVPWTYYHTSPSSSSGYKSGAFNIFGSFAYQLMSKVNTPAGYLPMSSSTIIIWDPETNTISTYSVSGVLYQSAIVNRPTSYSRRNINLSSLTHGAFVPGKKLKSIREIAEYMRTVAILPLITHPCSTYTTNSLFCSATDCIFSGRCASNTVGMPAGTADPNVILHWSTSTWYVDKSLSMTSTTMSTAVKYFGDAIQITGSPGPINVGASGSLTYLGSSIVNTSRSFSIELGLFITDNARGNKCSILQYGGTSAMYGKIELLPDMTIQFSTGNAGLDAIFETVTYTGKWVSMLFTHDQPSRASRLYIDGILQNTVREVVLVPFTGPGLGTFTIGGNGTFAGMAYRNVKVHYDRVVIPAASVA